MTKKLQFIILFLLIFISGLLIFKNKLVYSNDAVLSTSVSPMDGNICVATDNTTYNMITLFVEDGLPDDTIFNLYLESGEEESLVETRTVRNGIKTVNFYLYDSVRIELLNEETYSPLELVTECQLTTAIRHISLVHHDTNWFIGITCLTIISIILAYMVMRTESSANIINVTQNTGTQTTAMQSLGPRNSSIELLRCLCMLILVGHHYAVHGGLLNLAPSIQKTIGLIFLPTGKIAFLAFIAISMYYLVDGTPRFSRFFVCWAEVFFYSVVVRFYGNIPRSDRVDFAC